MVNSLGYSSHERTLGHKSLFQKLTLILSDGRIRIFAARLDTKNTLRPLQRGHLRHGARDFKVCF
jgi:hypothetical protein